MKGDNHLHATSFFFQATNNNDAQSKTTEG